MLFHYLVLRLVLANSVTLSFVLLAGFFALPLWHTIVPRGYSREARLAPCGTYLLKLIVLEHNLVLRLIGNSAQLLHRLSEPLSLSHIDCHVDIVAVEGHMY